MATIEVTPATLGRAAVRVGRLAELVRAESAAASRSAADWSIASLDERLPGSRAAAAAAHAGVEFGRACDALATALDGLADALRRAARRYEAADEAATVR